MPEADLFKTSFLKIGYDGIGPLYASRYRRSGGVQAVSKYLYPRKNGQQGEDQGRLPVTITGELLFFQNLIPGESELYPKRFIQVNRAKSLPGARIFVDPDVGGILGRFAQFDVSYSAGEVNGCRVEYTFEEYTEDEQAEGTDAKDRLDKALEAAGAADAGITLIFERSRQPATTLTADVEGIQSLVSLPSSTIQDIQGRVNAVRDKVNGILAQKEMIEAANFEIYKKARAVAAYCQDAAAAAKTGDATQMLPYVLQRDAGPVDLALEIYGDRDRAPDIIAQNSSKTFFFGKGRTLYVPDR